MEIIGRISKGSKMDQVYIQKQRQGLPIGSHVLISPLETKKEELKPFFYHVQTLEPLKIGIINEIFSTINKELECENIIVTGSFLDKGFKFNDIDVMIITNNKTPTAHIKKKLEEMLRSNIQLITIDMKSLVQGMATDPLYLMMLSRFVSMKRVVFNKAERRINPEVLDLHLLISETLPLNFDHLTGNEKYKITRNMVAIAAFLDKKKLSANFIDNDIRKIFGLSSANVIKENMLDKHDFVKKYKQMYKKTFDRIMEHVHAKKQKSPD